MMPLLISRLDRDQSTKPSTFEDWMGVYKLASMGQFDAVSFPIVYALEVACLTETLMTQYSLSVPSHFRFVKRQKML